MSETAHHGTPELKPIDSRTLDRLGRAVYCHHCRELTEMAILGRDAWCRVVYHCPCGGEVRIELAKAHYPPSDPRSFGVLVPRWEHRRV